MPRLMVL